MTIKAKLSVAILAAMLALAALTAWRVEVASREAVRLASGQAVAAAARGLEGLERSDAEKLRTGLSLLATQPALAAAYRAGDRDRFLTLAQPLFAELRRNHDITHFYVHTPSKVNWVRVHSPPQFGDPIGRATLARAVETGDVGAGKELGKNGFALRVVEPWKVDGQVIGYLELGEEIDHFLDRMRAQTGDEYALLILKGRLDEKAWTAFYKDHHPWGPSPEHVVANNTTSDPMVAAGLSVEGLDADRLLPDLARDGKVWARGLVPVRDASGVLAGGLLVLHDVTALSASMAQARNVLLGMLAAAAIAMALLLVLATDLLVFSRLARMRTAIEGVGERLAGGDYDVRALPPTGPKDEIGRFEAFFSSFVQVIAGSLKELTAGR